MARAGLSPVSSSRPAPRPPGPQADAEICLVLADVHRRRGSAVASANRGHAPQLPAGLSVSRHPVPTPPGPRSLYAWIHGTAWPPGTTGPARGPSCDPETPSCRVGSDRKFPHYTLNTYMNSQGLDSGLGGKKGTNTQAQTRVMPVSESFHVNGLILCGHPQLGAPRRA